MDKNSTHNFKIDEALISLAFEYGEKPELSESSLAFIKNFARNFRTEKFDGGIMHDFVLN